MNQRMLLCIMAGQGNLKNKKPISGLAFVAMVVALFFSVVMIVLD